MKKLSLILSFIALTLFSAREAKALSTSPSSINFPNTLVGSTSAPQEVLLLRGATIAASVSSVSISGSSDFSIPAGGDQCSGKTLLFLSLLDQCSVTVVFSPTSSGYQSATLHLNTDAGNRSVSLDGTGTNPDISFSSISFNDTNVGSADTQTLTVTNNGSADFDVSSVTISGSNSNQFSISSDNCTGNLVAAGGGTCDLSIQFAPSDGGSFNAQLNVLSASLPSASLALSAEGLNPEVEISVPVFNTTDVGSSDTQTFVVTNNGSGDLDLTAILISGANAGQFSINQDNCSGTVVAAFGGTCNVDVTFRPALDGSLNAVFNVISTNSAGNAASFSADATLSSIAFSPVTFSNTEVGQSDVQNITLTNNGNSSISVLGLSLSGVNPSQFQISQDNCSGQILAGSGAGTCSVAISFNPQAVGIFLANLNLLSSAGVSSTSFNATGITAATPLLSLSASSLSYNTAALNTASAPQTLTLGNNGNANLVLGNLLLTGPNASNFTVTSDDCSSTILAASATCNVVIVYTGTATSTQTAVLVVESNDSISAHRVSLSGIVVLPTPSVTPVTPSNASGGGCSLALVNGTFSFSTLLSFMMVLSGMMIFRRIKN